MPGRWSGLVLALANSWTRTYDLSAGHQVYDWLLRFER